MSGLLQRLAAQAMGKGGPAVHSLARIPYVAPLELAPEIATPSVWSQQAEPRDITTAGVAGPLHRPPDRSPLEGLEARLASERRAPPTKRTVTDLDSPSSPTAERGKGTPAAAGWPQEAAVDEASRAARPRTVEHPTEQNNPSSTRPPPLADTPGRIQASPPDHGFPVALLSTRMEEAPSPTYGGTEEPGPAEPSTPNHFLPPAPLLSPSRRTRPQETSGVHYASSRPLEVRRVDEPETTEVHVHIGRIEVTAVHELPPRKSKPVGGRKPMSLDQYLARRKEERG